ncbi:MAG: TolC family protein [Acidobacteriota bacterium]
MRISSGPNFGCSALAFAAGLLLFPAAGRAEERTSLGLLEAVEIALESDPNIRLAETQVDASFASVLSAESLFDLGLTVDLDFEDSTTPTSETSERVRRVLSESVAASRVLRSGQTLQTRLSFDQNLSVSGEPVSTGTFSFTVRQPLRRGFRAEAVTASERAARGDLEASELELVQSIAQRLLAVVNRYWAARAAMQDLEILREVEERSREFLASTRRLVEANLTPSADLLQLEADLISREATRVAGERSLFRALQDLGQEIGLEPEEIIDLEMPEDPFPSIEVEKVPTSARAYVAEAIASRPDLAAAQQRLQSAELRRLGAEDAVKPLLDLVLTPSFTGLVEGDRPSDALLAIRRNVPGVSFSVGLSYSFPLANRAARGALLRASVAAEQQSLTVRAQRVQIGADVPTALDAVRASGQQLSKLAAAVELFEQVLSNEERRLQVGSSTLIDVLNQRDRLTSAQQRLVSARLALAQALVSLRFETGTLVRRSPNGVQTVRVEDLTTLPLRGE